MSAVNSDIPIRGTLALFESFYSVIELADKFEQRHEHNFSVRLSAAKVEPKSI